MDDGKMDGLSMDIENEEQEKLRSLFPQCFVDGKLSVTKLLEACGEFDTIDENDREKYEFRWKGKQEAQQLAGKRSAGALRPCPEESVNWEETQNLYIEGDNLEVLKLLQRTYFRKVKMIYIDPPYNTGQDFVYSDDFADPLARYREITKQTTKSNPEAMGRFHTNWLNMMYPRLRLAANLLRDDGVIFISIDETEQPNLRKLCDEIFGEENHVADFVWRNKRGGGNDAKYVAVEHEYVIMYAKSIMNLQELFVPYSPNYLKRYKEEDGIGKYFWDTFKRKSGKQYYAITCPDGSVLESDEYGNPLSWLRSEARFKSDLEQGEVRIIDINGVWSVQFKQRLPEGKKPRTIFLEESIFEEQGTTSNGSSETLELFQKNIFSNPKPLGLLKHLLSFDTADDDIILDFFSGSATTAHAVMQLNSEDNGNRRFIMVQLPEITDEKSEAHKAGFKNICEIGKERIRRAGAKISAERGEQLAIDDAENTPLDIGFKVFKLDSSNLKIWDDSPISGDDALYQLEIRLKGMLDIIKPDRSELDIVYEVMLKLGQELTKPIIPLTVNGKKVYGIGTGNGDEVKFIICFAPGITPEDAEGMVGYAPGRIIFANDCFGNSEEKTNVKLTLNDKGIAMKSL